MAQFLTRVELHNGKAEDYDKLHGAMGAEGFSRRITSDNGVTYHLPTAEYYAEGDVTTRYVLVAAKRAAATVGKSFGVIVAEVDAFAWNGLRPA